MPYSLSSSTFRKTRKSHVLRSSHITEQILLAYNALASMHSAVPLIIDAVMNGDLGEDRCSGIPDEGAQKRFDTYRKMFQSLPERGRLIVCGKKRVGDTRKVFIQDGDCEGKRILIVDDIVKTGGTLAECAKTLKRQVQRRFVRTVRVPFKYHMNHTQIARI